MARKYLTTEKFGFPRTSFPVKWAGHEIFLLHNDAHTTADDRFQIHLTLYCSLCDEENTVRGRLTPEFEDYNYRSALAKLLVLSYFVEECGCRSN